MLAGSILIAIWTFGCFAVQGQDYWSSRFGVRRVLPTESQLPELSSLLERRIHVGFTRAHLSEISAEIYYRTDLPVLYPKPIGKTVEFSLPIGVYSVGEVLERFARQSDLRLEYHDGAAVFWRRASGETIDSLRAIALDAKRVDQAIAMERLADLADPRVYPILFRSIEVALSDAKDCAAAWAGVHGLLEKHFSTVRFAQDRHLVEPILRHLAAIDPPPQASRSYENIIWLATSVDHPSCGLPLMNRALAGRNKDNQSPSTANFVNRISSVRDKRLVAPLIGLMPHTVEVPADYDWGGVLLSEGLIESAIAQIGGEEAQTYLLRRMRAQQAESNTRHESSTYYPGLLALAGAKNGFDRLAAMCEQSPEGGDDVKEGVPKQENAAQGLTEQGSGSGGSFGGGAPGPPPPFHAQVAGALGQTMDRRAVETLKGLLKHSDPQVREAAMYHLVKMGILPFEDEVARLLARDLGPLPTTNDNGEQERYRWEVGRRAKYGDRKSVDRLIGWLSPENLSHTPYVSDWRRRTAELLNEVPDSGALEPLIEVMIDEDPNTGFAAAMAIARIRTPQAARRVAELLESEHPQQSRYACWILGEMGYPFSLDALQTLIKDDDHRVQQYRLQAISKLKLSQGRDFCTNLLAKGDWRVRNQLLSCCSELNVDEKPSQRRVSALWEMLGDDDRRVQLDGAFGILRTRHVPLIRRMVRFAMRHEDGRELLSQLIESFPGQNGCFGLTSASSACSRSVLKRLMNDEKERP